ncbi:hypothetical protein CHS0354_031660 [Potamilus streckersoni]|uniref:Uncharacterized protein n=1 Tax=Potamilus streckersoni TaxID=2493646 RepID=A0AAE0WBE9_9BIVA|nr:hypothetical protein CHS0354_031660 [Potamilus streckersoni]
METDTRSQVGPTTVHTIDTYVIEQISDYQFQENIIHPLQSVCRQLHTIIAKLGKWGKQHHISDEDCRCPTHYRRCHSSREPRPDGCDSLKLAFELAEETEPQLTFSNPGSRDAQFQLLNESADETEFKCPYSNQRLRDSTSNITMEHDEMGKLKFSHCYLGPRVATGQEAQNESISLNQKNEEKKSDIDDRYCLSKAIQKNLTLLIDVLPYRESELPDFLGEVCLTDNENNRIRGNEQREDQIRLLLRTIMGRSFCDMKHFLDYAGKFNPEEVNKVWKTYDDLKMDGNVEKRCIICLVMAYVDIKYVADVMYEKDLIPDSLYGRASDCRLSFGCQNKLWKELCRLFQRCVCKDDLVETLIIALENKSKYRYLGEELRKYDKQVLATLKCSCNTNQQRTKQTRPDLSIRTGPRGSSSGATSYSPWSSCSDVSSVRNRNSNSRRSSCLRRKMFAQGNRRGHSLHQNKSRQKENTKIATKSICHSSNGMLERFVTLQYPETSIISSFPSSFGEEMVYNGASGSQIPSKITWFQDCMTTTHCNNSRTCERKSFNNGGQVVLPQGHQKMLPSFLEDIKHFSEHQKGMSVGEESSMTPEHRAPGQIKSNKTILAPTVETISFRNISSIPTFNTGENKYCQASEVFCPASQCGERTGFEIKTHTRTEEDDVSNGRNKEPYTVTNDSESDLFDTERRNSIAKTENDSAEMSVTPAEQKRLQSKRPSLTRGLAIDRIGCNIKNGSHNTDETLSNVDESEAGMLPSSINDGGF